ncbi:bifunctional D-glycero-beta-D-manno-heptose-7-phosphate kinase/D-glycero-beta-D-manno-heptose 1-phosphate adenylyltransferase HldE [Geopsychrobacter electrodiphilus]|uniref:bifunctional D-glycero-beta-D-manno-heptose-7-phosphate kinase/D-glycero-beta-D-manno-heptose 1-phosphate adenylyltransferase HldE n=1 Tax=Geopsychrobacter electrodiphilus TaxID=225196 RepID=UPI00035FD407|nr:bifunctional D-glycero-beta-D-manno-heptose-7-phosphate kinase/D-glycero-beta-D-manno-heptose 1-phosphate adenylyltransferase HldE [Geopsychrobacter electrodiphilus]
MTGNEIKEFFLRAKQLKALVVGDLMLDEYLWGKAERISPEAPVAVVDITRQDMRLGGAGNVINNLLSLGCEVRVASVIGDDEDGRTILTRLELRGVEADGVVLSALRKTSRKTRVLASNQQMLRIDRESREEIDLASSQQLLTYVHQQLPQVQVVLLSDYLKGVLTDSLTRELIALCRSAKVPVLVDPKGKDYTKYQGATLLTPNRKEAAEASGVAISSGDDVSRAGWKLLQELSLDALILTRSEEGMSLFMAGRDEIQLPTLAREVFDVSGAGDTVLATIGFGLAGGLGLPDAARLANLAAGVVVGKVGTSTVTPDEILRSIRVDVDRTDAKIRTSNELQQILLEEKNHGRSIVFTNGCFDLLHVGHVKYLQKARALGDRLVLGLNSDASIRRLKGEKRPLIGEEERGHILAALDCIDYVCVFDEDTPLELIDLLRPDILVKGGDYLAAEVVGKEIVESYGGRVELISFVDGKSTTNIIEKILSQYREE